MASQELLCIDKEDRQLSPQDVLDWASSSLHVLGSNTTGAGLSREPGSGEAQDGGSGRAERRNSVPTEFKLGHLAEEKFTVCCDEELETSFIYIDENVNLQLASLDGCWESGHRPMRHAEGSTEGLSEPSLVTEDNLTLGEAPGSSVDYGFISAVTFLVTGISLVIIAYSVPRDVVVDRDSISAREMERLEADSARIGAHLDRCVIAGLCLLTLGGVVLSTLLMVAMWKGEMYRRKAFAHTKHATKLYGSINLKTRSSPTHSAARLSLEEEVEETLN